MSSLCPECHETTTIFDQYGRCPTCIAASSNFGKQPTDPHDASRTCDRCGDAFEVQVDEFLCAKCDAILERDYPLNPNALAEQYLEDRDSYRRQVSALTETIRARDEAIARYSRDLRVAERQIEEMRRVQYDLEEERDEWKARAEELEEDKASYERLAWRWYDEARKFERRLSALVSAHGSTSSSTLHMAGSIHTTAMSLRGTPYCYCGGRWHRIGEQG